MSMANNVPSKQPCNENNKTNNNDTDIAQMISDSEPILCFAPPSDTIIHRPMVNLAEFLSSYSICLNSYEDRIGVNVKGEKLCTDRLNSIKDLIRSNSKRQRHDSGGGDKKSPEYKRSKSDNDLKKLNEIKLTDKEKLPSSGMDTFDENKFEDEFIKLIDLNTFELDGVALIEPSTGIDDQDGSFEEKNGCDATTQQNVSLIKSNNIPKTSSSNICTIDLNNTQIHANTNKNDCSVINDNNTVVSGSSNTSSNHNKQLMDIKTKNKKETKSQCSKKKDNNRRETFRPLLNEGVVKEIKKGWNVEDVGDLTIGDLYIMFGQDFKVNLEYSWMPKRVVDASRLNEQVGEICKIESSDIPDIKPSIDAHTNSLGNKLKQLLLLANMSEKTKKPCTCGHYCDKGFKSKVKFGI